MWEAQNGLGCVRPHECGLMCWGFIVPVLNWNVPCTSCARKNDKILPGFWRCGEPRGVHQHQTVFHLVQFALSKKRLKPASLIIHQGLRWSNGAKISQVYIFL